MSLTAALNKIDRMMAKRIERVAPFRAIVTAVDGQRITIRRVGSSTADTQWHASCARFLLAVDDEVLCAMLGGVPVVIDRIRRSAAASPTFAAQTGAGATATTASSAGSDDIGVIQLVPGGAGIASGAQVLVTFAVTRPNANYGVWLEELSSAAAAATAVVRPTSRTTTTWTLQADSALTGGSTYQWFYRIEHYPT